jgi:hypothetical protein
MFDLSLFIKKMLERFGFTIPEDSNLTIDLIAKDIANYVLYNEGKVTPENVKDLIEDGSAKIPNGSQNGVDLWAFGDFIATGKRGLENLVFSKNFSNYLAAYFYRYNPEKGLIYGEYNNESQEMLVYYYNIESVKFAESLISGEYCAVLNEIIKNLRNEEYGIVPDESYKKRYCEGSGFAEEIDEATERFFNSEKKTR